MCAREEASAQHGVDTIVDSDIALHAVTARCPFEALISWRATCKQMRTVIASDSVWRQLLCEHYRVLLEGFEEASAEGVVSKLDASVLEKLYAQLHRSNARPYGSALSNRARLALEIHELRDWDLLLKELLQQRRRRFVAESLERAAEVQSAKEKVTTTVLQLHVLLLLAQVPPPARPSDVTFGPNAEAELQGMMASRQERRRRWWQQQRDFLIQDLEWRG